ncbi:hypothetical protein [Kordia jejudonensis]|uniref:hypothetical protein n=1 Tax=Kordia jejudonensis TaxID=1348245 RepID=UPI0006292F6E|nr:hypothetical protein [Kordia jejudonensis]
MKKYLTLFIIVFSVYFNTAQNIEFKDDIAFIDGKPYLKIERKSKYKFLVYDVKTNEKLIKVTTQKKYNEINQFMYYMTRFYFFTIKKELTFNEKVFESEYGVIEFLYEHQVLVSDTAITTKKVIDDYKRLSTKASCEKILRNDYSQILIDNFPSVVNKDTLFINEVKYRCVHSAAYTKKVMFDRFGMWDKGIVTHKYSRHPNLVWQNVKLLPDIDKKFTVITRGVESRQTIYASVMIFDENGNDMLAPNSVLRYRLVGLFGLFIRENTRDRAFYDIYWKKLDKYDWNVVQEYKRQ